MTAAQNPTTITLTDNNDAAAADQLNEIIFDHDYAGHDLVHYEDVAWTECVAATCRAIRGEGVTEGLAGITVTLTRIPEPDQCACDTCEENRNAF